MNIKWKSFNFIYYIFWQHVFDALICNTAITLRFHWTLFWTTSSRNLDVCCMCMILYSFIILKTKVEIVVCYGGENYTSIVQCYAPLVELNDASFQNNFLWKQQVLCDGWIWMESKPCCEKILNHIQQVIRISCIWQLQVALYGYVAMKKVMQPTNVNLGIRHVTRHKYTLRKDTPR